MSGVNLDALDEEQVNELIAGCRILRSLRAQYTLEDREVQTAGSASPATVSVLPDSKQTGAEARVPDD
jgi:hypothetical protein